MAACAVYHVIHSTLGMRASHCAGSNTRYGEVQQQLTGPSRDRPLQMAQSHSLHRLQGASMPESFNHGHPPHVSVATQVTPQLHARTLSHLRPVLQPRGTAAAASSPYLSQALPPRSSLRDRTNGSYVTPHLSARPGFTEPYHTGFARSSAPAGVSEGTMKSVQQGQNAQNRYLARCVPCTPRRQHERRRHACICSWS